MSFQWAWAWNKLGSRTLRFLEIWPDILWLLIRFCGGATDEGGEDEADVDGCFRGRNKVPLAAENQNPFRLLPALPPFFAEDH
jgi:hypothetical protein